MHEVLVNTLGGLSLPRKSVVRLTDRPDMTLDVYRGRKTTMQQQQNYWLLSFAIIFPVSLMDSSSLRKFKVLFKPARSWKFHNKGDPNEWEYYVISKGQYPERQCQFYSILF